VTIRADLHNHSCLSPCGDLAASPIAIARTAAERGIDLVALTDHNSARNAPAFAEACRRYGVMALFGTETTTREEVHVLSIFSTVSAAEEWGAWVYRRLPDFRHDPERFGDQVVVDADENILDFEERYLIPAHIDRPANSLLSQLGFLPDDAYSALEITRWPPAVDPRGHTLICDSDAHFLDDIGRRTFSFESHRELSARSPGDAVFSALRDALAAGTPTLSIAP
jgi:PHP family Zn ribbon phosphoesterase